MIWTKRDGEKMIPQAKFYFKMHMLVFDQVPLGTLSMIKAASCNNHKPVTRDDSSRILAD